MLELQKVGTDVEMFLIDRNRGIPIPVVGLLGGTKKNPKPVPELGEGFCVQEDNVMVEFNLPPASTSPEFAISMMRMKEYLFGLFAPRGLDLVCTPSMFFPPESLQSRQAQVFGCEPDFNAWEMCENNVDRSDPEIANLRTAGGHIHVSFLENGATPSLEAGIRLVKVLDVTLGLPSILRDPDSTRRLLYGKAGAFRPKPYGIEYRTLSNFWAGDAENTYWAFEGVENAINFINRAGYDACDLFLSSVAEHVRASIDRSCPSPDLLAIQDAMDLYK